jgi:hypothetical protein
MNIFMHVFVYIYIFIYVYICVYIYINMYYHSGIVGQDLISEGQNVGSSPFTVYVLNTVAHGLTSTAMGPGVTAVNVSYPTFHTVTVRDVYSNIALNVVNVVTMLVNGVGGFRVSVFDFKNGSYYVQYTPVISGSTLVSVMVNGQPIFGSPFSVYSDDVSSDANTTYAIGPNLYLGLFCIFSYLSMFVLIYIYVYRHIYI